MNPHPRSRSAWSRAWALACLVLFAAGCAAARYEPPTTGPTATLRIGSPYKGVNMRVRTYATEDCADYPGQLVGLLNSKTAGTTYENPIETRLAAGRDVTISVYAQTGVHARGGTITTKACEPFTRFRPEPGGRYFAEYQYAGGHCALPIFRLVTEGAGERRIPEPTAAANDRCRPATLKP
jgi:hypothetical protein